MRMIASFGPWACIVAILAGGCAHEPPDGQGGPERGGPPPGGPPFLSGPMGAVLPSNADGFVARVTFEIQTPEGRTDVLTGDLIGRGSKFVFTPEASGEREHAERSVAGQRTSCSGREIHLRRVQPRAGPAGCRQSRRTCL